MRLRNIYILCRDNLELIQSLSSVTWQGNTSYVEVKNWDNVIIAREQMSNIGYIEKELSALIRSVPDIYRHQTAFKVSTTEWSKIEHAKRLLIERMVAVIDLYDSFGFEDGETVGIDIKLPKCDDFLEFKKCIEELEFILYKCPFFRVEGEELKFKSVDVGSIWFNFLVAGIGADLASKIANNIAVFIDKCMVIKSHKLSIEQQKVQLETMKMEQKEKENLLNGIDKIFQSQVDDIISKMENETGIKLKDGEERGVVAQSFEKANALIDKGLQIYTTIDSPKEIQVLFEPLESQYSLIEQGIKLLEEKESEE